MNRPPETPMRMAITDTAGEGWPDAEGRRRGLAAWARRWACAGVELLQLREKGLDAGELLELSRAMLAAIPAGCPARLLVNGRADVAAAAGAHGVQLTSRAGELTPEQVRRIFKDRAAFVAVSCHRGDEVERARFAGADAILFGPVFEKRAGGRIVVPGVGLDALRRACQAAGAVPVLALGGVDADTAAACLEAGAAGFASIRAFASRRSPAPPPL